MNVIAKSAQIKRRVGYVPAEINYYDDMKVGTLLDYSQRFYGSVDRKRRDALCGLFDRDTARRIDDLSTGNKKKVAIVQALLHNPELLILDEPTSGLEWGYVVLSLGIVLVSLIAAWLIYQRKDILT